MDEQGKLTRIGQPVAVGATASTMLCVRVWVEGELVARRQFAEARFTDGSCSLTQRSQGLRRANGFLLQFLPCGQQRIHQRDTITQRRH